MDDFTILHLSDLHIDTDGTRLSLLLKNLLNDIKNEMRYSKHILLVVTGDIVNKANFNNRKNVRVFFEKLKEILDDKIENIYIVPGNHDKSRNKFDKKILKKYYKNQDEFYPNIWKYLRLAFDDYTELVKEIYGIFYGENIATERVFRDTYGVHIDKINGKNVCVLQFNTAWSCTGDNDERNLCIGTFQVEQIKKEYEEACEKLKNEKIDLTIALGHHPLNWLVGKEENMLQAELLSDNSLNTNIYISGHTHNRDVINWQNNRHSLTTLVSGLGWPDGSTEHPYAHNYASYVFNLDVNSIDVYARSSNDAYKFEPDFRIYTQERNKKYNKIVMPINSCKTQAYFRLGAVANRTAKSYYITEKTINDLSLYSQILEKMTVGMVERLNNIKMDVYDMICFEEDEKQINQLCELENYWFRGSGDIKSVFGFYRKYPEWMHMQFSAYLLHICKSIYTSIMELKPDAVIRTHFRVLNIKNGKYYQNSIYGENFKGYEMKPKKWGELIEKAFESKCPLIASVNTDYCKPSIKENQNKEKMCPKWNDFITVIPCFYENVYIKRDKGIKSYMEERPFLTFGVTVYREEDKEILYILDYLKIDDTVGRLISIFLQYFPINFIKYSQSLKKGDEENDNEAK